mgnify:CR=1 FL=1
MKVILQIPDRWAKSGPARRQVLPQGGGSGGRWPFPACCGQDGRCRRCGCPAPDGACSSPKAGRYSPRQGGSLALCQHVGDVQQLVCRVVRELDLVGEAAGKTAVGGKEHLHLPGVARQNDHQLVPVVLHALHKGVDGFETKAVLLAAVEAVGFIDKQHTAEALSMTLFVSGAVWPV